MNLGQGLSDKHVLVTCASSGLGAHFARLAAGCGARVTLAARRLDRLDALAAELRATGASVAPLAMDVTDDASVNAALDAATGAHGPLDVLVNNAGIAGSGRAETLALADFDAVLATNLRGVWSASTGAARRWIEAKRGGVIVNVASILGERVAAGVAPYAASKAAVIQATKALALEWARHGIRVNALAPGYISTDLNTDFFAGEAGQAMLRRIPMRRLGEPQELDTPFLLLATDAGAYMTGSVLVVDGGHLVSSL